MGICNNIEFNYRVVKCIANNNNTLIQWSNINYTRDLDKKNTYLKLVGNYKGAMMHGFKKCKTLNPKAREVANLQSKN
jgi:hypothetical protein